LNKESRLAVVIPAYNEEQTLGQVIDAVHAKNLAIIVVSDGSKDRTVEIATQKQAHVIDHGTNKGYEAALSTGVHAAHEMGFELVATFDADGQLSPEDLVLFTKKLDEDKSDVVIGIRSYRNRYSENLLALFGRLRFQIKDPLCGLKLYRLSKASKHFPFDTRKLVGMELAFKMVSDGGKVSQLPINVRKREGESRYGTSLRGEMFILKSLKTAISQFGMRG
jgi:glycosyltransferase involved in cell wall biosynthesis